MKGKVRWRGSRTVKALAFLLAVLFAAAAGAGVLSLAGLASNASVNRYFNRIENALASDYELLREYLFFYLYADTLTEPGQEEYDALTAQLSETESNLLYRVTDADGEEVLANCTEEELGQLQQDSGALQDYTIDVTETAMGAQDSLTTWEVSRYGLGVNRMLTYYLDMNGVEDWEVRAGTESDWASTGRTGDYYYNPEDLYDGLNFADRQALSDYLAGQGIQTAVSWDTDTGEIVTDEVTEDETGFDTAAALDEAADTAPLEGQYYYFVYTGEDTWYTIELSISPTLRADDQYSWAIEEYQSAQANYAAYFQPLVIASAVCVFLLLVMMGVLAWTSGWDSEGTLAMRGLCRGPIELVAALLALAAGTFFLGFASMLNLSWLPDCLLGGAILGGGVGACALTGWYVLTAQIKARALWKHSLIGWVFRLIFGGGRKIGSAARRLVSDGGQKLKAGARRAAETWPLYRKVLLLTVVYSVIQMLWSAILWQDMFYYGSFGGLLGLAACWLLHSLPLVLPGAVLCKWAVDWRRIRDGAEKIAGGELDYTIDTAHMLSDLRRHGEQLGNISQGMSRAVEERVKSQRFKTELITNVSHDLKTPLTSIINYVDLLKKEDIQDEKIRGYIDVLDRKSQRLKTLTEDLVEASKAASGTIAVHLERLDLSQLVGQAVGEYEEKLTQAGLTPVVSTPGGPCCVMADGRHLWRILDNLLGNCTKYAMPGTRVYLDLERREDRYQVTVKNISADPLNVPAEELLKRFVRGDSSRTSEGSGLGLSIARNLASAQGGDFDLVVDGDLFKAIVSFPAAPEQPEEPPAAPKPHPTAPRPHPAAPKSAPSAPSAPPAEPAGAGAPAAEENPPAPPAAAVSEPDDGEKKETPDPLETLLEGLDG